MVGQGQELIWRRYQDTVAQEIAIFKKNSINKLTEPSFIRNSLIMAKIHIICQNLLHKIIQEPDHPVTTSLIKNIRSTTIFNLDKTKIAKTESHNQSFVLKYIRILRDKRVEQKKNCTKRLS
jgi:hypothetical protein